MRKVFLRGLPNPVPEERRGRVMYEGFTRTDMPEMAFAYEDGEKKDTSIIGDPLEIRIINDQLTNLSRMASICHLGADLPAVRIDGLTVFKVTVIEGERESELKIEKLFHSWAESQCPVQACKSLVWLALAMDTHDRLPGLKLKNFNDCLFS